MKKRTRSISILLTLVMVFALVMVQMPLATPVSAAAYKVVGYVYGMPGSIDATKLTHINYAFGSISNSTVSANTNDLRTLVGLKSQNSSLKVVLSIGGWGAEGFCDAAATDAARTTFANSCLSIINSTGIDGIDLDWEYPVNGGWGMIKCSPADKQNYTLLLQKIRNTIGSGKILTIAAGASSEFINNTEITSIASICDYINLMTYDYGAATHNANLYNTSTYSPGISDDMAVTNYIGAGVPASKLNLGIPFYGRYGSAWPTYADLVANYIGKNGWTRYWDNAAKACYLLNGSGGFITYDDPETIGYKTAYIKSKALGGAMFWQYAQDSNGTLLNKIWSDLNGGGSTPTPTPTATPTPNGTATPTPATTPTPTPAVTPTPTPGGAAAWAPNTWYNVNQLCTYGGSTYKCIQAHTSLVGWEPPNVPALWQLQ